MEKRPSKEQLAIFKKNANNQSLSAEVRAKFQAVVDKFENIGEDVVDAVEGKKERKPRTSKGKKQTGDDIEKAKAEIKRRTGKTEEECEKIVEEYRSLRTKSQERKEKEAEASKTNVERINKLKKEDKVIEGTNEKTADAVIETTTKDVADKIEKQIEAVEEKAETEAKKEVEKEMPKVSATEKKKAVKEKVEEKVKEKTKTIVKRVVIDTSALLTTIAESLGKFDKDSQKEFLIKLRSDIDKLISKYSFGGLTDGGVQVMNIQQSNLSSSSVNPTMFGGGGGVEGMGVIEKFFELDNKYSKNAQKGELVYVHKQYRNDKLFLQRILSKDNVLKSIERDIDKRNPIIKIIPQKIDDSGYMKVNLKEFNGDILEITYNESNVKDIYEKVRVYGNGGGVGNKTLTRQYLEKKGTNTFTFGYGMPKDAIDKYGTKGGSEYFILPNGDIYKKSKDDSDKFVLIGNKSKMSTGGGVEAITPELNKRVKERAEEIYRTNKGKTKKDFDNAFNNAIREFGYSPQIYHQTMREIGAEYDESDEFGNGGGVGSLNYNDILAVLKEKVEEGVDNIPNYYESASDFKGEEIEHESRDGFIPYTNGGYEAVWFETLGSLFSSGYSLPTEPLDTEKDRQIDYNLEYARESFGSDYPEIVEELGEENINYNSLYDAGYQDEAEELSNAEMDMMFEDTIMMRILANYYNPSNSRAKDGKHTIRLFGDVNLESPYHRVGNLDDSYEYEFTFDSIDELKREMDKGIKMVNAWFNGDMYNESNAEMKIRKMTRGGGVEGELKSARGTAYYVLDDSGDTYYDSESQFYRYVDKGIIKTYYFDVKVKNQSNIVQAIYDEMESDGLLKNGEYIQIIGFELRTNYDFESELPYDLEEDEEEYDDRKMKRGGGVYNRSWHQDHSRHNKRENYEVPVSLRKKSHGGTIEERMRMRRGR